MGKIRDEIDYRKRAKVAKSMYLEMNFERMILLLTSAIMGYDMKNDSMGNLHITSVPLEDRPPCSTVLSFDAGSDSFEGAFQNIAMVQDYFKDEISQFLLADKPFDTFYDAFHHLMTVFYSERNRDDNDWQLNNAKNLVCKSSTRLQTLFNERPDRHSGCKESVYFGALQCLGHYSHMPKWSSYASKRENCLPINIFNSQNKSMPPLTVGIEIDLCNRFKQLNKPTISELVAQGVSPVEAVEQGGYADDTKKGEAYIEYYDMINYLGINHNIKIDIPQYSDENFWHSYRLRHYFKTM